MLGHAKVCCVGASPDSVLISKCHRIVVQDEDGARTESKVAGELWKCDPSAGPRGKCMKMRSEYLKMLEKVENV